MSFLKICVLLALCTFPVAKQMEHQCLMWHFCKIHATLYFLKCLIAEILKHQLYFFPILCNCRCFFLKFFTILCFFKRYVLTVAKQLWYQRLVFGKTCIHCNSNVGCVCVKWVGCLFTIGFYVLFFFYLGFYLPLIYKVLNLVRRGFHNMFLGFLIKFCLRQNNPC